MLKTIVIMSALTGALALSSCLTLAAADQKQTQQKQVYGSELMTEQEREEHRSKMRAAETDEEREQIRSEQHERMKKRAKERGMTLPDQPPVSGGGMGPGGRNN
jgi:outer membrane murein-binding lipoprotein Lpp